MHAAKTVIRLQGGEQAIQTAGLRPSLVAVGGRNLWLLLEERELASLEPDDSRDIEIVQFVDRSLINRYIRPYWLGPDDDEQAYASFVRALERQEMEGLVKWVMRKKSYIGALQAERHYLRLITLRNSEQIIAASDLPPPEGRPFEKEGNIWWKPMAVLATAKERRWRRSTCWKPSRFKPQLAVLVDQVPLQEDWLHEIKFDGYRLLCRIDSNGVTLLTRQGKNWSDRFPSILDAAADLRTQNTILDGEVVVLTKEGKSDFQALQNVMNQRQGRDPGIVYYVFDLPFCNGYNLSRVPLAHRKRLLADLLGHGKKGVIRFSDHIEGAGDSVYQEACRRQLEGIISKRAGSPYLQKRSKNWLKVKCVKRQEFVIGGWTDPTGSREGFGALLMGYFDQQQHLIYSGRVGTGFDSRSLTRIKSKLDQLNLKKPLFVDPPQGRNARSAHWVKPKLVAEIEFTEWTADGKLRHPSFQGLREDKSPAKVSREEPADHSPPNNGGQQAQTLDAMKKEKKKHTYAGVTLTHPHRVLYPDQSLTKTDLAEYYYGIADWALPYLVHRPLTLVRCPKGRAQACFYQKHLTQSIPDPVRGVEIKEKNAKRTYTFIEDLPGLMMLVQLGVLEIHPWGAQNDDLDKPDSMIFDLDPDENVAWPKMIEAARELKTRLENLNLQSFLRTTGGKGLHIMVPLVRRSTWDDVKTFAKSLAASMAADHPNEYTDTASRAKRKGKIYIDYLRNSRGATAVANYSTRARPGAPVATPIRWSDLGKNLRPDQFNTANIPKRLSSLKQDPWKEFFEIRQSITKTMLRKVNT